MHRALCVSPTAPTLALSLLLALAGCGSSTTSSDPKTGDPAAVRQGDGGAPSRVSDAALAQDTARSGNSTPDATQARADLAAPDTFTGNKDAAREDAVIPADTLVAVDSTPQRTDTATREDAVLRADASALDTLTKEPDATTLACKQVVPTPTLTHLTAQELKAILDGSENPYLINVKGTSIANIPGTDAVLANDVPGIEALVGKDLCADIILYCRSGATSQTVGNQLVAKGYQRVRDLSGGIGAWTAAGYATE